MIERFSKDLIPEGIYCHGYNYVCPYYSRIDEITGWCNLENVEVIDMCKECMINEGIDDEDDIDFLESDS